MAALACLLAAVSGSCVGCGSDSLRPDLERVGPRGRGNKFGQIAKKSRSAYTADNPTMGQYIWRTLAIRALKGPGKNWG